jgi:hypothetical protein
MGGNLDESLLSTASTLIDSCSTSLNESFDDTTGQDDESKEKNGIKPFLCRGRITNLSAGRTNSKKGNTEIASPITTAINLEIIESATCTDRTERTTASKLDRLRVKTRLLRKQGSQKIEETRASLRKSRTIPIESPPTPSPHPPPYPPPSVHNTATAGRTKRDDFELTIDFKHDPDVELSNFLRRSNSVIDRLSTEIAMAGSIINQSGHDRDTIFNDSTVTKINGFASNLYDQDKYSDIGQDQQSIHNEDNSLHNISIGEDWDQTTISVTPPGSPSSSAMESRQISAKAPPRRSMFNSGLPPPEVLVKRISTRAPPRADPRVAEVSFSGSTSSSFAPIAVVDRHRLQRPPSISSLRGDCASMYNKNQKCEKLAMENDCLKRQLDLLESRHRDAQRKLMEQLHRKKHQEEQEEQTIASSTTETSQSNTYGYHRKKKKRSNRHRMAVLLLLASFLISSTLWFYPSVLNISLSRTNDSSIADGIGLAFMKRGGVLRQALFRETVFSDNSSDTNNEEHCIIDDLDDEPDNLLVLHEPPTIYREFENANNDESNSGKKAGRFKRFVSRMQIGHEQNPMGVWLKTHRKITTKKHHAEL